MPRCKPHHHPCQTCGAKTECGGTWEENYDGTPDVICPEFHELDGTMNSDFVCEGCWWLEEERADEHKAEENKAAERDGDV